MSKATLDQEKTRDDAATEPQSPFLLTGAILARGVIFEGKVLTHVVLAWDGGELKSALPQPADDAAGHAGQSIDPKLRDRIMTALRESDIALNRKQLAKKLGLKDARGRFASTMKAMEEVRKQIGLLVSEGYYTDDESKFSDDASDDDDGG